MGTTSPESIVPKRAAEVAELAPLAHIPTVHSAVKNEECPLISDILTPREWQLCSFSFMATLGPLHVAGDVSGPVAKHWSLHHRTEGSWVPVDIRDAWVPVDIIRE